MEGSVQRSAFCELRQAAGYKTVAALAGEIDRPRRTIASWDTGRYLPKWPEVQKLPMRSARRGSLLKHCTCISLCGDRASTVPYLVVVGVGFEARHLSVSRFRVRIAAKSAPMNKGTASIESYASDAQPS